MVAEGRSGTGAWGGWGGRGNLQAASFPHEPGPSLLPSGISRTSLKTQPAVFPLISEPLPEPHLLLWIIEGAKYFLLKTSTRQGVM